MSDTKSQIAVVIFFGHVSLLIIAFFVYVYGHMDRDEVVQSLLMGSPLLAVTGPAALASINKRKPTQKSIQVTAHPLNLYICVIFVIMLFVCYLFGLFPLGLHSNDIKITIGIIETIFGLYIGVINETVIRK